MMNKEKCEWIGDKDDELRKIWMNLIWYKEYGEDWRIVRNRWMHWGIGRWMKENGCELSTMYIYQGTREWITEYECV